MPQVIEEGVTELGQHYEVNFENGVKVLNSKNTNYSFGSLHQIMLKGIDEVLKTHQPKSILMLGLGAGSAIDILNRRCNWQHQITVVEIDQKLIEIAKEHFNLSHYEHVTTIQGDASLVVKELNKGHYDLIIDDVFWDDDVPAFCRSTEYLEANAALLNKNGVYMRNTMAMQAEASHLFEKALKSTFTEFDSVTHQVYKNKIYFCRKLNSK